MTKLKLYDCDSNLIELCEEVLAVRSKFVYHLPCPQCKLLFLHISETWRNDRWPESIVRGDASIDKDYHNYVVQCPRCDCLFYAGRPQEGWTKIKLLKEGI